MKRDLAALVEKTFDLLVIGGGVIGACVARDAARRGMSVALVEQNDFASAASEAMSRTIHGGIRYLSSGKFSLVRTGLREREIWKRIAPDFVSEQIWILPLPGRAHGLQLSVGVAMYQWLSGRKRRSMSASELLLAQPWLRSTSEHGACVYQDFHLPDPHRLILAILMDAAKNGAVVANHMTAQALSTGHENSKRVEAVDQLSGAKFSIAATRIVNATGAWAQPVANKLVPGQRSVAVTGSKGIHIVTPDFTGKAAVAIAGKGEHLFVVPWHGMSLIGTTDESYKGNLNTVDADGAEVASFKEKVVRLMPGAESFVTKTLGSFAGVRALPGLSSDTYKAGREVMMIDHAQDGMPNVFTVCGGKWTTARLIAEQFVDMLVVRSAKILQPCDTRYAPVPNIPLPIIVADALKQAQRSEMAITVDDLGRRFGRHRLLANPELKMQIEQHFVSMADVNKTVAVPKGRHA